MKADVETKYVKAAAKAKVTENLMKSIMEAASVMKFATCNKICDSNNHMKNIHNIL